MIAVFLLKKATRALSVAALLFGFLVVCLPVAFGAELLALDRAVAQALADNPGLAAMQARAKAIADIPEQRGTLPDPRLSLSAANLPVDTFSFSQEGMTQLQIGVSQSLPYPGKLALQQAVASLEANAAVKTVDELRMQLIKDVKTIWWNIFYLDRAMETVTRNETLLKQVIAVAETKYEVGQGQQQDILLAQLELSKAQLEGVKLLGMRRKEQARLNALLGRDTDIEVQLPALEKTALPQINGDFPARVLQTQALQIRPRLNAQQININGAQARLDLAKKDYYPDFNLAAVYGFRSGDNPDGNARADMASILFSMSLPIYNNSRQRRLVDQRSNEWLQQKYAYDDQRAQVAAEITSALAGYRQAADQFRLIEDNVMPQARQTVDSMLAGYQVNKVDFLGLLRSQASLYEYENQYWKAFSAANQALAELAAAVGKESIYE